MPTNSNLLKGKRATLGLTQEQVATKIGIKQSHYTLYENKKHIPSLEKMDLIANALELPKDVVYEFFRK